MKSIYSLFLFLIFLAYMAIYFLFSAHINLRKFIYTLHERQILLHE